MTQSVRLWRAPPPATIAPAARRGMQRPHDAPRSRYPQAVVPAPTAVDAGRHARAEADEDHHGRHDALPRRSAPPAPTGDAAGDGPDQAGIARPGASMADRLVSTCSEIGAGYTVTEHLARLLSRFCASRHVGGGGQCWEVVLELDPSILPDTRLTLRLSPHTLSLRFQAGHPRARRLLSEHADALRQRIHDLLRQRIDVELELW